MEQLRDILAQFLDRSGLTRHVQHDELRRVWRELLGEAAEHTQLEVVRKNVATFRVDSAALLHELNNFRKAELLANLQAEVHGTFVREIKFRLGALKPTRS